MGLDTMVVCVYGCVFDGILMVMVVMMVRRRR